MSHDVQWIIMTGYAHAYLHTAAMLKLAPRWWVPKLGQNKTDPSSEVCPLLFYIFLEAIEVGTIYQLSLVWLSLHFNLRV